MSTALASRPPIRAGQSGARPIRQGDSLDANHRGAVRKAPLKQFGLVGSRLETEARLRVLQHVHRIDAIGCAYVDREPPSVAHRGKEIEFGFTTEATGAVEPPVVPDPLEAPALAGR